MKEESFTAEDAEFAEIGAFLSKNSLLSVLGASAVKSFFIQFYSASSRKSPNACAAGRSVIEKRIASSSVVFSWECHCQEGTTNKSPASQSKRFAETLVSPRPRKLWYTVVLMWRWVLVFSLGRSS